MKKLSFEAFVRLQNSTVVTGRINSVKLIPFEGKRVKVTVEVI